MKNRFNENNNGGLEVLVKEYQNTGDEYLFVEIWNEVKPFCIKMAQKYPSIPYEDRISIGMECLWECCKNLDNKHKLLTLYGRVYANRLLDMFYKKMQSHKFRINQEAASLDKMYEEVGFQPSVEPIEVFNKKEFYEEYNLQKQEIMLVELLDYGYKKAEIARLLKLKLKEYDQLLNGIRYKIISVKQNQL